MINGLSSSVYSKEQYNCSFFDVTFNYCLVHTDLPMKKNIVEDI
jgi:hypothetical protein